MKFYFSAIILLFTMPTLAVNLKKREKNPTSVYRVKSIVTKVKEDDLIKTLREFVKNNRPSRMVGTASHEKVASWLVEEIKRKDPDSEGLVIVDEFEPNLERAKKSYLQEFQNEIVGKFQPGDKIYQRWDSFTKNMIKRLDSFKGIKGKNVIWEKKGSKYPNEVLLLGAHYDTVIFDKKNMVVNNKGRQPGADNNGTGVSALLQMIELLSQVEIQKTIRIVFFDFQEFDFLGARAYLKKYKTPLKEENFNGMVNVLMLGHDTKNEDKEKKYGNFKAYGRKGTGGPSAHDRALFDMLSVAGKKMSSHIDFEYVGNNFNTGDHLPFWENGYPAVTFTQNWESDYNSKNHHTSNDFVETINFKSFYHSFLYLSGSVISWAMELK